MLHLIGTIVLQLGRKNMKVYFEYNHISNRCKEMVLFNFPAAPHDSFPQKPRASMGSLMSYDVSLLWIL